VNKILAVKLAAAVTFAAQGCVVGTDGSVKETAFNHQVATRHNHEEAGEHDPCDGHSHLPESVCQEIKAGTINEVDQCLQATRETGSQAKDKNIAELCQLALHFQAEHR